MKLFKKHRAILKPTGCNSTPSYARKLWVEQLEDRRMLDAAGADALELFSTSTALFVANEGQWQDEAIKYAYNSAGANITFTEDGLNFQFIQREAVKSDSPELVENNDFELNAPLYEEQEFITHSTQFNVQFDGANASTPTGLNEAEAKFNYYVGEEENWASNVSGYEIVTYEDLYDGIDLHAFGRRDSLKYEFYVAPGANYEQIQVSYNGIEGLWIDDVGSLHITTELGELTDDAPYIYQVINGVKVEVAGQFALVDSDTYTFEISGAYDSSLELVIDPNVEWATYLGGNNTDDGNGIAVDAVGNVFVTGNTESSNYPTTPGVVDTSHNGYFDAFLTKFSSSGSLLWSTFFGGNKFDSGYDIAIDAVGNIIVVGETSSSDFPTTPGAMDTSHNASSDAFITKLSSSGAFLWSTYLGGNATDYARSVAVDTAGNVLVVGDTVSHHFPTVPETGNPYSRSNGHAFASKFSSDGILLWSTYLGGSDIQRGYGIAADATGNVWVTGQTSSSDFPPVSDVGGTNYSGRADAFVIKFSSSGTILWSTFLGGSENDYGLGITIDAAGNALVVGETSSDNFPTTPGAEDTSLGGSKDAFVTKFSNSGTLLWSTYLGGGGHDSGYSITADAAGNALVVGETSSSNFPTTPGAEDTSHNGNSDAFVTKLSSSGGLLWSTFLGGSGYDYGRGVAVDAAGNFLVVGETSSSNFPTTPGAEDTSYNGNGDAFVVKYERAVLLPSITKTLTGAQALWGSEFYDKQISENYEEEHGIQLGGGVQGMDESQPTYRFALPNPAISWSVYLTNITVSVTGLSNRGHGTRSGVKLSIGSSTWELPGENFEKTTTKTFNGGYRHNWSDILTEENGVWVLDVMLSAIEIDDYFDLRDVQVTYSYEGISDNDLARLDQIIGGITLVDQFRDFHQGYLVDGNVARRSDEALKAAHDAFFAESAFVISNSHLIDSAGVFGSAWQSVANVAYSNILEPAVNSMLAWPDLTSDLATGPWWHRDVRATDTWNAVNTLTDTLDSTINALTSLQGVYYTSLQNDGRIMDDETSTIVNQISIADTALDSLELAAQSLATKLVVDSYNATRPVYQEDTAKAIEAYLATMATLYQYDYVVGVTSPRNETKSYLTSYYQPLLNLQEKDLPRSFFANAGGPYSVPEGSDVTLNGINSDGSIVSYLWDFDNDGLYDDASGATVSFNQTDDGIYTVGLKVINNNGKESTGSATVAVINIAPTPDAGGPYYLTLGNSIELDATNSDDPGNDILSYQWDLDNDGFFDDASGLNPVLTPSASGMLTVSVRVTDNDGASSVDTTTIIVNVPPIIPGDFDADGNVDADDFNAWKTGYGTQAGATLSNGDADGDGDVDGSDFLVWQTNYQDSSSDTGTGSSISQNGNSSSEGSGSNSSNQVEGKSTNKSGTKDAKNNSTSSYSRFATKIGKNHQDKPKSKPSSLESSSLAYNPKQFFVMSSWNNHQTEFGFDTDVRFVPRATPILNGRLEHEAELGNHLQNRDLSVQLLRNAKDDYFAGSLIAKRRFASLTDQDGGNVSDIDKESLDGVFEKTELRGRLW